MNSLVAVVGRPNVGKSTLLNRLAEKKVALVFDIPGVTRDRLFADVRVGEREVTLVDTGGFDPESEDVLIRGSVVLTKEAIADADMVLLVVDAKDGLHPLDGEVADYLRRHKKPSLCLVNKSDPQAGGRDPWEFHRLGLDLLPVSALHGTGMSDLKEWMLAHLPEPEPIRAGAGPINFDFRMCLVGRPNVGKSSIANRLLGQERQLVSDIPGTTRDAVDLTLEQGGIRCLLVDTPGVRRKARVHENMERASVMAALRSLERADVAGLVLDSTQPFSDQDARLLAMAQERGICILALVNKVDALSARQRIDYQSQLRHGMRFAPYVPILECSAKTGLNVEGVLPTARDAIQQADHRIPTGELNRFFGDVIEKHEPPLLKGKRAKIYFLTQTNVRPPTFVLMVNDATRIAESYRRYLENQLRKRFAFRGTPIRWVYREKDSKRRGR